MENAVELAASIGFDEIEWGVREGSHIEPAQVKRDLRRASSWRS
jgi:hypothetical protein